MSIVDTGFVSEAQEQYLRQNEPSLYKAVLKKHGSFLQTKKKHEGVSNLTNTSLPSVRRGRGRKR